MTLIIEDGTMPAGANSYATVAQADDRLIARGNTKWGSLTLQDKEKILLQACDVINSYSYLGKTTLPGRIMAFPRIGIEYSEGVPVPENFIPLQVIYAQIEIAGSMASDSFMPLKRVDTTKGAVTSASVDVISVSYSDPVKSSYQGTTGFPYVDSLLKPFFDYKRKRRFCYPAKGKIMSQFYENLRDTASDLIASFGASVDFTRTEKGQYNPATGKFIQNTTTYSAVSVKTRIANTFIDGVRILASDAMLIVDTSGTIPQVGDIAIISGEKWQIVQDMRVDPAGLVVVGTKKRRRSTFEAALTAKRILPKAKRKAKKSTFSSGLRAKRKKVKKSNEFIDALTADRIGSRKKTDQFSRAYNAKRSQDPTLMAQQLAINSLHNEFAAAANAKRSIDQELLKNNIFTSGKELFGAISSLIDAVDIDVSTLLRAIALEAHGRLVMRTPKDTGRAAGGWFFDEHETDYSPEKQDSYQSEIENNAAKLSSIDINSNFFLLNNVEYLEPLENGHSRQAPQGGEKGEFGRSQRTGVYFVDVIAPNPTDEQEALELAEHIELKFRRDATANQSPEFTDSPEKIGSRGIVDQYRNATPPATANIPMVFRVSSALGGKPQGHDMLVSMFGETSLNAKPTFKLNADITATIKTIVLKDVVGILPPSGVIKVETEFIFYEKLTKSLTTVTLSECTRGYHNSTAALHTADTTGVLDSLVYYQGDCSKTFTLWLQTDHFTEAITGCTVNQASISLQNDGPIMFDITSLQGMQMLFAGTCPVKTTTTAGAQAVVVDDARFYSVGMKIYNADINDDNSGSGYTITAIDYVTNTLTLDTAIASNWAGGEFVSGWLPTPESIGTALLGSDAAITFDGVKGAIRGTTITYNNNTQYITDEIGTKYPARFVDGVRQISFEMSAYFDRKDGHKPQEGYEGKQVDTLISLKNDLRENGVGDPDGFYTKPLFAADEAKIERKAKVDGREESAWKEKLVWCLQDWEGFLDIAGNILPCTTDVILQLYAETKRLNNRMSMLSEAKTGGTVGFVEFKREQADMEKRLADLQKQRESVVSSLAQAEKGLLREERNLSREQDRLTAQLEKAGREEAKSIEQKRKMSSGFDAVEASSAKLFTRLVSGASVIATLTSAYKGLYDVGVSLPVSLERSNATFEQSLRVSGQLSSSVTKEVYALRELGLSTVEAQGTIAELARVNIDASRSSDIVRAAQNAAAITGKTLAETTDLLTSAIATGNKVGLRSIGVTVDYESALRQLARQTGQTVDELGANQVVAARLEATLKATTAQTGAAAAVNETLSGKIDLAAAAGRSFVETTASIIGVSSAAKGAVDNFTQGPAAARAFAAANGQAGIEVGKLVDGLNKLNSTAESTSVDNLRIQIDTATESLNAGRLSIFQYIGAIASLAAAQGKAANAAKNKQDSERERLITYAENSPDFVKEARRKKLNKDKENASLLFSDDPKKLKQVVAAL
ncbi:hypothetical protein AAG570_014016, partial [Ranatra chinensis]